MEGPRKRLEKEVQGVEGEERVHEDGWGGNVTAVLLVVAVSYNWAQYK